MEIEVLLQEWAHDPDRAVQWQDTLEEERHRVFCFGKVLQRIKHHQGVDDNLVMPQREEYHVHSMMLHPAPRHTQEVVLMDLVWQTSEVLIHLERVRNAALTLALSDDARFAVDPDTPPDAWQRRSPHVWPGGVVGQGHGRATDHEQHGVLTPPGEPPPPTPRPLLPSRHRR
ncbi:hypothetical protein D5R93_00975 [Actinomyces lilanjuaniae]|uniref:Uncharacterized protein n=1 Tax=Actinomyces lilanjuaniae TaxID=2321394 RepID=A0ABM6Z1H9_9ACTO|nr:hypothetical protein [Actinomyces lilanjuaniae]AYD88980.1 hypothetical protein D5R93_00975 [Actinomyces lilanjuaniae]